MTKRIKNLLSKHHFATGGGIGVSEPLCAQESDEPAPRLTACLGRSNIHRTPDASRIPIAALTSRVCAFRAAGLRRGLQWSFTRVRRIGLHVWLLIVMVRI